MELCWRQPSFSAICSFQNCSDMDSQPEMLSYVSCCCGDTVDIFIFWQPKFPPLPLSQVHLFPLQSLCQPRGKKCSFFMHIFYSTLRDQSTKSMGLDTVLLPGVVIFIACCPPWHCKLDVHKQQHPKGFEWRLECCQKFSHNLAFNWFGKARRTSVSMVLNSCVGMNVCWLSLYLFWATCSVLPGLAFVTPDLMFCLKSYGEKSRDL